MSITTSRSKLIQTDMEQQSWYNEYIKVGHVDVQYANRWPIVSTPDDLTNNNYTATFILFASVPMSTLGFIGWVCPKPPSSKGTTSAARASPHGYHLTSLPRLSSPKKITDNWPRGQVWGF